MPESPQHVLHVECANCKQQIEANKYIFGPPQDWTLNNIHLVTVAEGFVGTVRCPHCFHFTVYQKRKVREQRVPSSPL